MKKNCDPTRKSDISLLKLVINNQMQYTLLLFIFFQLFLNACHTSIPEKKMRIITHNIWNGFTEVPERKEIWIEWLNEKKPDVLALQELNYYTEEKLKEDALQWGHRYTALLKQEGFPTGITSRFPIEDVQRTLKGFHHGLLRVRIQDIYFYVIHLHPSNSEMRMQEVELILEDINTLPEAARIVMAGDFNALSKVDSIYYSGGNLKDFFYKRDKANAENNLRNESLDYEVINTIVKHGFIDTEVAGRMNNCKFKGSFPTAVEKPGEQGDNRRLDYVFVSHTLGQSVSASNIICNDRTLTLSDHLPVLTDIRW